MRYTTPKKAAIAFAKWIKAKGYITDDDDFWYEIPEHKHEKGYGQCIATSTESLYNLFIAEKTTHP